MYKNFPRSRLKFHGNREIEKPETSWEIFRPAIPEGNPTCHVLKTLIFYQNRAKVELFLQKNCKTFEQKYTFFLNNICQKNTMLIFAQSVRTN